MQLEISMQFTQLKQQQVQLRDVRPILRHFIPYGRTKRHEEKRKQNKMTMINI